MAYATTIQNADQDVQYILKIAGVDRYFASFNLGTWDDSAYGNTHGSLTVNHDIVSTSPSGGKLDHANYLVTSSTLSVDILDSAYLRGVLSMHVTSQYLGAAIAAATDPVTVTIDDTTPYSPNDYIHIGKETLKINSVDNATDMTCARAQLGTVAEYHPIGTETGSTPRHWDGRRAYLVTATKNRAGDYEYQEFKTYYLENVPTFHNGVWSMQMSSGLQMYDRSVYMGFDETSINKIELLNTGGTSFYRVHVNDTSTFIGSSDESAAFIHAGDMAGVFLISSITAASGYFDIDFENNLLVNDGPRTLTDFIEAMAGSYQSIISREGGRIQSVQYFAGVPVKHVLYLGSLVNSSNPADMLLRIMLSDTGDGSIDADYDTLPGLAPTTTWHQLRAGAGLTTDQVDKASWLAAASSSIRATNFILGAKGEERLLDIIKEVAPLLGGYVYINTDGKIAFKKYSAAAVSTTVSQTLNDANTLGSDNLQLDEKTVISSITIHSGYSVIDDKYKRVFNAYYSNRHHQYKDQRGKIEIKSRMGAISDWQVKEIFDALILRWGHGATRVKVSTPWFGHVIIPGDTVRLTNSRLPNLTDGTLGIENVIFEVVGVHPYLDEGRVTLDLIKRPTVKLISPVLKIDGAPVGNVVDIDPTYYTEHDPDDEWSAGWSVKVIDGSNGDERGADIIDTITATSLTFDSIPVGTADGDWIIFNDYAAVGGGSYTQTNALHGADMLDFAYIGDNTQNPDGDQWL